MKIRQTVSVFLGLFLGACSVIAAENNPPKEYLTWLSELKAEMSQRGISKQTLDIAFAKNYYHPKHKVIKHDRNQNEFILTTSEYLSRVLSPLRVQEGRKQYLQLSKQYKNKKYNVPLKYLVAFWGIETNFGQHKGGYNAIEALTILSFDNRRPKFFREQLYNALKIIDEGHVEFENMESSWAGAMGHFQFMPTTFNAYAIDGNQDGKINIWSDFSDAIASADNYLSEIGWKSDEPWGVPVSLRWDFDYSNSGRHIKKSIKEWKQLGVNVQGVKDNLKASLILPEGYRNQAYLVFDNFRIIMEWNISENYALAVGLLADKISSSNKIHKIQKSTAYRLTKKDISTIQNFIIKQKIAPIKSDGSLGTQTRKAIQELQRRFKLPADGYPDYKLMQNIVNFKKNGYNPSIPSPKLHK